MAFNLYREGDPLPEAGADIQAFVEQTMLMDLSEDARDALDDMVLFRVRSPRWTLWASNALANLTNVRFCGGRRGTPRLRFNT